MDEYVRVEFEFDCDTGTEAEEIAAVNAQIEAAEKVLAERPEWQAFDADDGTGALLCGPPGIANPNHRVDDGW